MSRAGSVSRSLIAWGKGDPAALEQLTPPIYRELHKLANPARAAYRLHDYRHARAKFARRHVGGVD